MVKGNFSFSRSELGLMLRKVRDLFAAYNKRAGGRTLTQAMLLGFARALTKNSRSGVKDQSGTQVKRHL
jgi:hypothetical protein